MGDFDRPKADTDIIVEQGELRRMRDPRTGQIKEVDMSIAALSRTMEQIRKSAEIINQPSTSFDMAMSRFEYIKELVLDHAQFSPKLKNLQIKINGRTIEVVKEIEELDSARTNYARGHFMNRAKAELAKENRANREGRRKAVEKALDIMNSGARYLEGDGETEKYIKALREELGAL